MNGHKLSFEQRCQLAINNTILPFLSISGNLPEIRSILIAFRPPGIKGLKESHTCGSNYSGSAPNMEATGAKRIFERSKQKNILRYSEFYGDGDSKSFPTIEYTYPEKRSLKRECIGHVQKRVGTRLRKLKKNIKGLGGKGKLTEALIDRLQNYYGIAIRSNVGNLEKMKQSIHATLFHVASSDVNNWHQHCPEGKESWCSFKADRANGTKTYKAGKGLPLAVLQHVKPIFKDLSEDSLLERCLHGKTQNHNESFNGIVWNRIPKTTYVRFDQFQVGVYDAVCHFNIGNNAVIKIYEKLGLKPGNNTYIGCKHLNEKRLKNASMKEMKKTKLRRCVLRGKNKKKADNDLEVEGETYACGAY